MRHQIYHQLPHEPELSLSNNNAFACCQTISFNDDGGRVGIKISMSICGRFETAVCGGWNVIGGANIFGKALQTSPAKFDSLILPLIYSRYYPKQFEHPTGRTYERKKS